MRTGEGKTLVSTLAGLPERARRATGVHIVTVNDYLARRDAEWMGQIYRFLGLTVGLVVRRDRRLRGQARRLRTPTSPTARTPSSASTTCATTWPADRDADGAARLQLRDRRRGRLDPHRRGPHAAHHLRARRTSRRGSTTSSRASPGRSCATRTTRSTRRSGPSCRPRTGIAKVERQLGVENLYDVGRGRTTSTSSSKALEAKELYQPGQGLHRRRRRGEDRRRVHRPDPRGPALVRRPAPGRRGQGAGPDQRGEPHLGDGHAAELLPHVREARRHDRHRRDRGGRVRLDLRARRSCRSRRNRAMVRADQPDLDLQDRGRRSSTPSSRTSSSATRRASRSSSARPRSRSPSSSPGCSTSRASRTPC